MKKIILLTIIIGVVALSACSAQATATPQATPVPIGLDSGQVTPAVGFVLTVSATGVQAYTLYAAPDSRSQKIGTIPPGTKGELLGVNSAGDWVYAKFDDLIGWLPIQVVSLSIDNY